MDVKLVEQLLYEEESTTLDFKKEQYRFVKATEEQKSELLKDILGFANAFRRSDAYILIGVEEVRGGRSNVTGITDHLDDHSLQQFVNNLTTRPLQFGYEACPLDGKQVGVIRIDLQAHPVYLKKDFGKLKREKVYVRRGSSTDPTKPASPEEVFQMGVTVDAISPEAELAIEFAEIDRDHSLGTKIPWSAEFCEMPEMEKIPKQSRRRQTNPFCIDLDAMQSNASNHVLNEQYFRELANHEFFRRLFHSVRFVVTNKGKAAAGDVRVELTIPKGNRVGIYGSSDTPDQPMRKRSRFDLIQSSVRNVRPNIRHVGDVSIDVNNDRFRVEIECGNLQPGRKIWSDVLYIGIAETGEFTLNGKLYARNLSEPKAFALTIDANITKSQMTVDEILDLPQAGKENDEPKNDDDD